MSRTLLRTARGRSGAMLLAVWLVVPLVLGLAACAGGPPAPDWHADAKSAMDQAVRAYLLGDNRGEALHFARARAHIARSGRPDLLARAELMRCAAHVASLDLEPCEGFDKLRMDAAAPERAYAGHLSARMLSLEDVILLPAAQRPASLALSSSSQAPKAETLAAIEDPLSRLVAISVLFQGGRASAEMLTLASDTASRQGWRRPLLAWLNVRASLAAKAGDAAEAARLHRRIELAGGGGAP